MGRHINQWEGISDKTRSALPSQFTLKADCKNHKLDNRTAARVTLAVDSNYLSCARPKSAWSEPGCCNCGPVWPRANCACEAMAHLELCVHVCVMCVCVQATRNSHAATCSTGNPTALSSTPCRLVCIPLLLHGTHMGCQGSAGTDTKQSMHDAVG